MKRFHSQIVGTKIIHSKEGNILGVASSLIVDPKNGKIEALWVRPVTLPISNAIMTVGSIIEWKKNIYIESDAEFAEPSDIVRIADILEAKTEFVGNQVVSEEGVYLGNVVDLEFDDEKGFVTNIMTEKSFFIFGYSSRVFPYDSIIDVRPEEIIVKDLEIKKVKDEVVIKKGQPALDV